MQTLSRNSTLWGYLEPDLQGLISDGEILLDTAETNKGKVSDFSYLVFPFSKAYEGFLKTLFHDLGFISDEDFNGKRFRIGKALNPSLENHLREKEGVYDKLVSFCQGSELADTLWETWKKARNLLFHWFPNERNAINFEEARVRINIILDTMDLAFKECKIERTDA